MTHRPDQPRAAALPETSSEDEATAANEVLAELQKQQGELGDAYKELGSSEETHRMLSIIQENVSCWRS